MTRNNLEQFNKSSPSLIFCSLWIARELLQYLVRATGRSCSTHLSWHGWWHRRELHCLSFLPQIILKHSATGTAHILGMSWLSPSLEDKWRKFFTLEKGKLLGGLLAPSSTKRGYKSAGGGLWTRDFEQDYKGEWLWGSTGIGKKFCTERVVRHWNKLPRETMDVPSLEVFKARVDGALSSLDKWKVSLPCGSRVGLDDL